MYGRHGDSKGHGGGGPWVVRNIFDALREVVNSVAELGSNNERDDCLAHVYLFALLVRITEFPSLGCMFVT